MPRRRRPAFRLPPQTNLHSIRPNVTSSRKASDTQPVPTKLHRPGSASINEDDESSEDSQTEDDALNMNFSAHDSSTSNHEESEDDGADAPRIAQWVDEEELDSWMPHFREDEDEPELERYSGSSRVQLKTLEDDISTLPLGALRKAHRTLAETKKNGASEDAGSSESEGDDSQTDEEHNAHALPRTGSEKPEWSTRARKDIAKRSNKHAPMEVTSKRPVTRRRTVVQMKTVQPRDPRFLPLAGELSSEKFQQQYDFLADLHTDELKTLRDNLKRARKRLASSPRDLHAEREYEVSRLEQAVKRCESTVNRDRRQKVDAEALGKVAKQEREKRKQGKGGWWMKESDKKDLLVRARYDALAATGGKQAVKKAIEKKQKKLSQKEKKSRPFAKGQRDGSQGGMKRLRASNTQEGERSGKRRKIG